MNEGRKEKLVNKTIRGSQIKFDQTEEENFEREEAASDGTTMMLMISDGCGMMTVSGEMEATYVFYFINNSEVRRLESKVSGRAAE